MPSSTQPRRPFNRPDPFAEVSTRNLGGKARRGGAITAGSQLVRLFIQLARTAVLARLIEPFDFGLIATVVVYTQVLSVFAESGLSGAAVQSKTLNRRQAATLFWINIAIGALLTLIMIALAWPIAWVYDQPELFAIVSVSSFGFLISAVAQQHLALLRRQLRWWSVSSVPVVSMLVSTAVAIAVAQYSPTYWALVAMTLSYAITTAVMAPLLTGWLPGRPGPLRESADLLRFGSHMLGFGVLNKLSRSVDNWLLSFVGPVQLAFYDKAYQLMLKPIRQINSPISAMAMPVLSRIQDEPERFRNAFAEVQEKIAMILLPLFAVLIVAGDWVILVMLGEQWEQSIPIFRWLGVVGLVQGLTNSNGWVMMSQGRTADILKWGVFSATTTVASFAIGLPWGAQGVAIAYTLYSVGINTPALVWWIGRRGHISSLDYIRPNLTAVPAALAAAGVALALRMNLPVGPFVGLLCVVGASAVIVAWVYLMVPRSRRALLAIVRSPGKKA
ncbi:MAG: lipopolysaccharide biosynthesis protein [Planctomycetota bacterium]